MKVKNNYNECITNLACSIRKYFDLDYKHNTLDYIDKLLEEKNPKNVVLILFDGMGSKILKRNLNNDDYFIKNMFKEITKVFPATTTAATTSIRTGLNPVEHGWLGWNTYIKPLDKVMTLFMKSEKGTEDVINEDFSKVLKNQLKNKTIVKEINEQNKYSSYELMPFGDNKYLDLNDMVEKIKYLSKEPNKKYIYAYDDEPDHTMHEYGPDSIEVIDLIKMRNKKIEELSENLEDTIIFVVADHGHTLVENINIREYKTIYNLLERTTSNEPRSCVFKVKHNKEKEFEKEFNKHLGKYFNLYKKEEVIESKLFGDGITNELFNHAIGDYIAIAENSNKAILDEGDSALKSTHAGYTDDEIYIPLIIIDKTNK